MNILTFDIEEWYHLLELRSTSKPEQWVKFEPRLEANTDRILSLLDDTGVKATFFAMGWVATQSPGVIRKIASCGHEVGIHSWDHALVSKLTRQEFREDIRRASHSIADITGVQSKMYRAPGFSIVKSNLWALEELAEQGFTADASIFPASRSHGGFPDFPVDRPCIVESGGLRIYEFPLNTTRYFGFKTVFSGGGYFRLMPYNAIKRLTRRSDYVMSYFHPRDFDPGQKFLPGLTPLRLFKSYYGLNNSIDKLKRWLTDFEFIDIDEAIRRTDWNKAEIIRI